METKKTNEKKMFKGLVEMNESQKKEVAGGVTAALLNPIVICTGLIAPPIFDDFPRPIGYPPILW